MPLVPLLVEFLLALSCSGGWLWFARRRGWFDLPNQRSSHTQPTPKSGGAGIAVAYTVFMGYCYASGQLGWPLLCLMLLGLGPAITGFIDDLRNLGVASRIGMQVLATGLALVLLHPLSELRLPGGLAVPGLWLTPLVLLSYIWLINLFNFMDGIDGLAAMEAIFTSLALALFASVLGDDVILLASLGLAVAVSGFLYFNLAPARLFMGDLGSHYLGYVLGALGLFAVQRELINYWTLGILFGVFVVDATTTLVGRICSGALWYHAHSSHAYQRAARQLRSHAKVVVAGALINGGWLLPLAWLSIGHEQSGLLIMLLAWSPLGIIVATLRLGIGFSPTLPGAKSPPSAG